MSFKKIKIGILFGTFAGILDVIPMLIQGLNWYANISAFTLWIISGFLIASSNLKIKGALKGIVISFLVLLPVAVIILEEEPLSLVPIFIMTLILSSLLGFMIENMGNT